MKSLFTTGFIIVALPFFTHAATIAELQAQLQALLNQIAVIERQTKLEISSTPACTFSRTLARGAKGADVVCLQNFLIAQGYLAAWNNTGFFGAATEAAVKKLQCTRLGICAGTPATTGYGLVGARTRSILMPQVAERPPKPPPQERPQDLSLSGACRFNESIVQSGASVTAYQSPSVASGQTCVAQQRTCTNASLSGTYTYSTCTVDVMPTSLLCGYSKPISSGSLSQAIATHPNETLRITGNVSVDNTLTVPTSSTICMDGGILRLAPGTVLSVDKFKAQPTVKVFDGDGSVKFTGALSAYPQWFGAKGDGTTDDAASFRKLFNAITSSPSATVKLLGKTYALSLVDTGLVVPEGSGVDGEGARINAKLTGGEKWGIMGNERSLFQMRSRTFVRNMTINNIAVGSADYPRNYVVVGHMGNGQGYHDVDIGNLTLLGGYAGHTAIEVTGDSSRVKVHDIHVLADNEIGAPISVEWGGIWTGIITNPDGSHAWGRTTHPHDVDIENIQVDALNKFANLPSDVLSSDCPVDVCQNWVIWLSAPYDVRIKHVRAGSVGNGITIYAGDFGSVAAPPEIKAKVGTGITIDDVIIGTANIRGLVIAGEPMNKASKIPSDIYQQLDFLDMPVKVSNFTATGIGWRADGVKRGDRNVGQGILLTNVKNAEFDRITLNNFTYGVDFAQNARNNRVSNATVDSSYRNSFVFQSALQTPPTDNLVNDCVIKKFNQARALDHSGAAILIGSSYDIQIKRCSIFGDGMQTLGVWMEDWGIASIPYLESNHVEGLRSDGAAYGTDIAGTSPSFVWYSKNNTASAGFSKYFGVSPIEM